MQRSSVGRDYPDSRVDRKAGSAGVAQFTRMPHPDHHRPSQFIQTIAKHIGSSAKGGKDFPPVAIRHRPPDFGEQFQLACRDLNAAQGVAGGIGIFLGEKVVQALDIRQCLGQSGYLGHGTRWPSAS